MYKLNIIHKVLMGLILAQTLNWVDAAESEIPKSLPLKYADYFLSASALGGNPLEVVAREVGPDQLKGLFRNLVDPTFGITLDPKNAVNIVFVETKTKREYALLVCETPKSLNQTFRSFQKLKLDGRLISKVLTYYHAAANSEVFIMLLSEQKPVPADSDLLVRMMEVLVPPAR